MPKNISQWIATGIIFFVLIRIGLGLAGLKQLENDETFSQVGSVGSSYSRILKGNLNGEGNNAPLFYILQKVLCDAFQFKTPKAWLDGQRFSQDSYGKIFLRIQSITFLSLAVTMIFNFFLIRFGWLAAGFSLIIFFSFPHPWLHFTEARHYALWIFLTTWQALELFAARGGSASGGKAGMTTHSLWWLKLSVIHVLLALTVFLSLGQIVIASIFLWLTRKELVSVDIPSPLGGGLGRGKDKTLLSFLFSPPLTPPTRGGEFIWLTAFPVGICLFYFSKAQHLKQALPPDPLGLIFSCFPPEQIILTTILFASLFIYTRFSNRILAQVQLRQEIGVAFKFFGFLVVLFAAALILLAGFKLRQGNEILGHKVSSRYFLFLTPVAAIGLTYLVAFWFRLLAPKRWLQWHFLTVLIFVLTLAYLNNYPAWVLNQWTGGMLPWLWQTVWR